MKKLFSILLVLAMLLALAPMALASEEAIVEENIIDEIVEIEEEAAESIGEPAEEVIVEEPIEDSVDEPTEAPALDGATYSGKCGENVTWSLDAAGGVLIISGTGNMADYYYDGQPWKSYKDSIRTVVIESGVTSIGKSAFDCYKNLTSVSIPDGVTAIGIDAFENCGLTSVTIPGSVKSIGSGAFFCSENLTSVTIGDGVETIEHSAFYNCDLRSLTLPDSVTTIGENAFISNENLKNVTIPTGVTSIGYHAFGYIMGSVKDTGVDGFTIGAYPGTAGEQYAKNNGFQVVAPAVPAILSGTCGENLTWSLDAASGLMTISGTGDMDDYDFDQPWYSYRDSIRTVVIKSGVTSIGKAAFSSCTNLSSVTIPDSVKRIGQLAFFLCENLKSATIPDSVTEIGQQAFGGCGLTYVKLSNSLTEIPLMMLQSNHDLKNVIIPEGVKIIGGYAFVGCDLQELTIPDSVETIAVGAFRDNVNLKSVTIPESITSIGEHAFGYTSSGITYTPLDGFTIYAYPGTAGEQYAKDNGFALVHIAKPALSFAADGKSVKAMGDIAGLYARVALVLDNNGVSGLYITQATINDDGTILIPEFKVPGLKVKGVNVSLVMNLSDIQSTTPTVEATATKMLGT